MTRCLRQGDVKFMPNHRLGRVAADKLPFFGKVQGVCQQIGHHCQAAALAWVQVAHAVKLHQQAIQHAVVFGLLTRFAGLVHIAVVHQPGKGAADVALPGSGALGQLGL